MPFRPTTASTLVVTMSAAVALGVVSPNDANATENPSSQEAVLEQVLVTATRSSQAVDVIPGTVTVVTRDDIERRQANDVADLFADEPDIAVPRDMRRFGGGNINIRGIEDNRILLLVDGVRATDYRSPGTTNYDAAARDLPDVDFLKQVEVVRGPGSSLYGSDAIGGVVGFITLGPDDFLTDGKTFASGVKLAHFTEDRADKATAWLASSRGNVDGLLMVSHTRSHELSNQGDVGGAGFLRTRPNPQDIDATGMLAKLGWQAAPEHHLLFTLEAKRKDSETDVQRISNLSGTSLSRVTENLGDDHLERNRLSLDYVFTPNDPRWFDRLSAKVYHQGQDTLDKNFQLRSDASISMAGGQANGCSASSAGDNTCEVYQRFDYEQSHRGLSMVMEKETTRFAPQYLTWGVDWIGTHTQEVKDTWWVNVGTGEVSNYMLGETYPKSEYPKGDMTQFGLFVQDEIQWLDGRLRVTPGLRYDSFRIDPDDDPMYHPVESASAVSKDGDRVSPKLAIAFEARPGWHVYGQYVEGYRAPDYEQVNRYFLNNQSFYGIVGNPDLKPETSRGLEAGLKFESATMGAQLAVFRNRYDDFIDYVRLTEGDSASLPAPYRITFQYRNLSDVEIDGFELRGHWQVRPTLRLTAAYAHAKGEYRIEDGEALPLNSVEPDRLSVSALWTPAETWGGEARLRYAWAKDEEEIDDELFATDAYAVADVGAWWQFHRNARLNVTVNNLFDETYWLWSDVRRASLPATDPAPEFYTQPGRTLSVSLKAEF
ncbi:MAG: TonB-dependent hemoglobin/transferrin/lactoferrin family receptor [Chromatiales bacterium]|nr:TonB-dependent hemoglobin/transferrin/lactoferrin family receptor [Chromatiales bacterium]